MSINFGVFENTGEINKHKTHENNINIKAKLSQLLNEHVAIKMTKFDKKPYNVLLNDAIQLEIKNNELERKIQILNNEIFFLKQNIIDAGIEMEELHILNNSLKNEMKLKEKTIFQFCNSENEIRKEGNKNYFQCEEEKEKTDNLTKNDTEIDLSLSQLSDLNFSVDIIDKDLLKSIKKKKGKEKKFEQNYNNLKQENINLIIDLKILNEEIKNLRSNLDEKDKIISILYQEIENLKEDNKIENCDKNKNLKRPEAYNSKIEKEAELSELKIRNNLITNLNDLHFILKSLVDFLKNYGIYEEYSKLNLSLNDNNENVTEIEHMIKVRMKEIQYVLVNLKKINIIFKSHFVDFTKNLIQIFQTYLEKILNDKIVKLENKFNKFSILINRK